VLGDEHRRASFATYAIGLLGDGERKSMEPIAARACPDPARVDAEHRRLAHFVSNASWRDVDVPREAAAHALAVLTKREPVVACIFDDTGFLKQGNHSVGVQRQYTGSAGKRCSNARRRLACRGGRCWATVRMAKAVRCAGPVATWNFRTRWA
jgi:SRSO17 transposase